jgi:hypothetical protein
MHNNVRPHTALPVKQFLAKQGIPELNQSPFSPDLSPPDFLFIPKYQIHTERKI